MEIRRFYIAPNYFERDRVIINGDDYEHMTKVLRHKVGYKIIVNNNVDGIDYHAEIVEINKTNAVAVIKDRVPNECKTKAHITLYQAVPKGDKLSMIVQKASELGVHSIVPFESEYSDRSEINIARLAKIAQEACKQCGRSRVPYVANLVSFDEMLASVQGSQTIFCNERELDTGLSSLELRAEEGEIVNIIVGSEGGFSVAEAQSIAKFAHSISLGKRILRCETASIAATAIVMYKLGEMS